MIRGKAHLAFWAICLESPPFGLNFGKWGMDYSWVFLGFTTASWKKVSWYEFTMASTSDIEDHFYGALTSNNQQIWTKHLAAVEVLH